MRLFARLLSLSVPFFLYASISRAQETPPPRLAPPAEKPANNQQPAQDGVEVQSRGQVHEAFASPSLDRQQAAPVIQKKPPEPVNELPPEQKPEGDNIRWIPGYWMWDDERSDFLWVSGTWRNIPPDRRWMPGYWVNSDGGYRWVSGYWMDQDDTQVTLLPEPPERVEEAAPTYNESTETYVPGMWVYHENRYAWRPGYRIANHAGWVWTPASYRWTPGGYVFVDGYWDYDLSRRGLAFAPVYINSRIALGDNWVYRPRYVLGVDFLQGALFVNAGWNHYYFGDYYDARYSQRGYQPWISYRNYGRYNDPLFSYYRWQHRDDNRWQSNLQNIYTGRRDGSMQRPGRTFAELNRTNQPGQTRSIVAIDQWKGDGFKLHTMKQDDDRKTIDHYRKLSTQRGRSEINRRASMANEPGSTNTTREPGKTTTPPTGKNTIPPDRQVNPPAKTNTPPSKADKEPETSRIPAKRYEVPKPDRSYQRGSDRQAVPQRPTPPPVQHNPGRGDNPGKGGERPGKGGDNPGKKG